MDVMLFYVTHSGKEQAGELIRYLLDQKLIACANLMPIESTYWWQGDLCSDAEVVTILKTRPELEATLEKAIMDKHPYDTPCIIRFPVKVNAEYGQWVRDETSS